MKPHSRPFVAVALAVGFSAAVALVKPNAARGQAADPFVGTFTDAETVFTLHAQATGYAGTVASDGMEVPVSGQKANAALLRGTISIVGNSVPFEARLQGDQLSVTANGQTSVLTRQAGAGSTPRTVPSATTPSAAALSSVAGLAPGESGDPQLGVAFRVPSGFVVERVGESFRIGMSGLPGGLVVIPNGLGSMAALRSAAPQGIVDGVVQLATQGSVRDFGANGVVMDLAGTLQGQPARGHAVSLVSPGGTGFTVVAMADAQSFQERHSQVVDALARSFRFFTPQAPSVTPAMSGWQRKLAGSRLTYLWRYNSGSSGGSFAGGSGQTQIDLCPQGHFTFSGSGGVAASAGSASGSSAGTNQGEGRWSVSARGGAPSLQLQFNDGRASEYALTEQDGKVFLNGTRYLVTFSGEHAPRCP